MKSTKTTQYASMVLLVLYVLYALSSLGMTGLLFSSAVGLLTYGIAESLEITTIIVVFVGVLYKLIIGNREGFVGSAKKVTGKSKEGFLLKGNLRNKSSEGFQPTNAQEVRANLERMKVGNPSGVLASSFVEGFANVSDDSTVKAVPDESAVKAVTGNAADSLPAPPALPTALPALPPSKDAGSGSSKPAPLEKFKNPADGLFKLGEIPTDEAGGFHIDQGTTVLSALNALKPDQIKGMSEDTQKLIETQKSLMGMLGTMKPMLQDGKQLLETFNTMFKN